MDEARIIEFLERLGSAVSSGDIQAIADCWDVPALVLADQGVRAVTAREEIAAFFAVGPVVQVARAVLDASRDREHRGARRTASLCQRPLARV
jgi:hypothetical protein